MVSIGNEEKSPIYSFQTLGKKDTLPFWFISYLLKFFL